MDHRSDCGSGRVSRIEVATVAIHVPSSGVSGTPTQESHGFYGVHCGTDMANGIDPCGCSQIVKDVRRRMVSPLKGYLVSLDKVVTI